MPLTIALAALIGEATDRSRALWVAATLHAWVNVLWEFSGPVTYAVLAAWPLFWGRMFWRWPKSLGFAGR